MHNKTSPIKNLAMIAAAVLILFTTNCCAEEAATVTEAPALPPCLEKIDKIVALTFDDGPSPKTTPQILSILKQYGAKATFFVVGENAEKQTSLMQDITNDGHEVGNHSFSHPMLARASSGRIKHELESTNQIIQNTTGSLPLWFRPPYGSTNKKVEQIAADMGLKTILWTDDPRDWSRHATKESIEKKVLNGMKPGSVVLLHDNHNATIEALPALLETMKERGYRFVSVNELKTEEHQVLLAKSSAACGVKTKLTS